MYSSVLPSVCVCVYGAGYLGWFLWAVCQKTPHAGLQALHVHLLGRFGVINLDDVDLEV